jgi:hypothetical protein
MGIGVNFFNPKLVYLCLGLRFLFELTARRFARSPFFVQHYDSLSSFMCCWDYILCIARGNLILRLMGAGKIQIQTSGY